MMSSNERPSIEELAGQAVHASALVVDPRRNETPLLRIAALGGASRMIAANEDRPALKPRGMSDALWSVAQRGIPSSARDRDRLEADLGRLLLRMRAGGDHTTPTVTAATMGFATWLASTRTWQAPEMVTHRSRLVVFSRQALLEYLFDRCHACGGCGMEERMPNGQPRRPRAYGQGNVRLVQCRTCHGTGTALPNINIRVDALGINFPDYKAEQWGIQFSRAAAWLDRIARRMSRPLRKQLERG